MTQAQPWHERDAFWQASRPILFPEGRLAAAPAEVAQMIALLGIAPGEDVLDLCCGIGRHSLEFARRGFRVTGVDRTQAYLDEASRNAAGEGLAVEFVRDDMRAFSRPDAFDAAISVFTSFGYFEDPEEDRRALLNVCRSLRLGGSFLLDMHGKETLARIFRERDWHEEDGTVILEERKLGQNWGWIESRWIMLEGTARTEFTVSHRLYAATELVALLTSCGFASTEVYGSLEGTPYDHTAKRLVAVAHK